MSEFQSQLPFKEQEISKEYTTALTLRERLDRFFHPVSTARMEQFRAIADVLPEGTLKKSYERIGPELRTILRPFDRQMVFREITTRVATLTVGTIFSGVGLGIMGASTFGAFTGAPWMFLGNIAGAPFAAMGGLAIAEGLGPQQIARQKADIKLEAMSAREFFQSKQGQEAAKAFDKTGTKENLIQTIMASITQRNFQLPGMPGGTANTAMDRI